MTNIKNILHQGHFPARRIVLLCLGFFVMALGVAFSIKASLGTSPISSLPYVTSVISGISVGGTTIIMNLAFVLIQIAILRKQYDWFQLLQIPAAILFGVMIDLASFLIRIIPVTSYVQQWLLCALGIFLVALGVSMEIAAGLITTAGEGIVLAICRVLPVRFGNMKVLFDVSLVCISIVLSFLFLGHLDGVREGTVAAAILVGQVTKKTNLLMKKLEPFLLKQTV